MGERLGVFGGTFDPPHVGHAIVAQDVLERLELDRLLIVPAGRPPHREAVLPAGLRYSLVEELFRDAPGLEVSDLELRRPGPSYTVDTLSAVRERWAPDILYCLIGSDQLRTIDSWHRYTELAELATVAVMTRAGEEVGSPVRGTIPHRTVEVTRVDLSSTRIRERLRAGRSVRFLVPERLRARVEAAWEELERSRAVGPALASERGGTKDQGASIS